MKIHRISGTFGCLHQDTLSLQDGLNIIYAPNEAGKSTWSALLTALLYGINSRERNRSGAIAEKNHYAPWDGAAMRGRLDCSQNGTAITLLRDTHRPAAPMADFTAVYTGTADPIPGLTALNCGETLLGVTREVWDRSALIRQGSLPVTQDAELERRITALISSGEEDVSYSEALSVIKKQQRLRRHHKTGALPSLKAELQEKRRQLEEIRALETQHANAVQSVKDLEQQEQALIRQAALQAQQNSAQTAETVRQTYAEAQERADRLERRIREQHIPDTDSIGRLRGAIVNLNVAKKAASKAREDRNAAAQALLEAEHALQESPFAGQSIENARRELQVPPRISSHPLPALLTILCILAAAVGCAYWFRTTAPLLSYGLLAGGVLLSAICGWAVQRRVRRTQQRSALQKRYGTSDPAEISALLDRYASLYQSMEAAQAEAERTRAAADALADSLTTNEQAILLEVRRFAPAAFDLSAADSALRSAFTVRKTLNDAQAATREAQTRMDLLSQQAAAPTSAVQSAALPGLRQRLAEARSAADRLSGQLQAQASPQTLLSQIQQMTARQAQLEQEYAALSLAEDALTAANTDLQNRFSPALGRQAAEIFRSLTDGRYSAVTLDRAFHLTAQPTGDSIPRAAGLLSAGTGDQLYLAVRLAICQLIFTGEDPAPIILDDALVNFDDTRCASALRYLKDLSHRQQILLFTCHRREADFFRDDPEVFVQTLAIPG